MTLGQLKEKKASLVQSLDNARNATFAEGTSETIKKNIIAGNVKRYKAQITKIQAQIDKIENRKTDKPNRKGKFEQTVLPPDFKLGE